MHLRVVSWLLAFCASVCACCRVFCGGVCVFWRAEATGRDVRLRWAGGCVARRPRRGLGAQTPLPGLPSEEFFPQLQGAVAMHSENRKQAAFIKLYLADLCCALVSLCTKPAQIYGSARERPPSLSELSGNGTHLFYRQHLLALWKLWFFFFTE